ncbi:M3 family metallopeptidase [Moraxella sp. VT-16-12]|uniref:M3 family metallopeptidase n=1 Tax=Moraxella sp. VT-16-12 TaxID=2014877 RepID=UPI000B7D4E1A|nr:M3 family metallopeptidase [Moraxella sp. VT-16-12]TWV81302.1 M3 family metallopeptidase [Moraxella sp. VT-16-12]
MITFTSPAFDSRLQLVDFDKTDAGTLSTLIHQDLQMADEFLDALPATDDPQVALDVINQFNRLMLALNRSFGVLSHLNSVVSTADIRTAHHEVLPKLSALHTKTGQSVALYQLYKLVDGDKNLLKDATLARAIVLSLQSFELSGVGLDDDKKAQFANIASKLSTLSAKFSDNALDASQAFALPLTEQQLSGITPTGLALLKSAGDAYKAKHPNTVLATDYVATLDVPMYLAVMQYADDRALRETLYHAYNTKASDQSTFGYTQFDNSQIMSEILSLRQQKARLLGFDDYTQVSLATKMADSKEEIEAFLLDLAHHATAFAKAELAEVSILAKTLGIDNVEPWDVPYLSEKIRSEKYNLNSEELRPYFPLPVVLSGLFGIIDKLFGVQFVERTSEVPRWHTDVQFFELIQDGQVIGGIYLDLFARNGKRGGAWLSTFQDKHKDQHGESLPVGFIVGNFSPAVGDLPSLLSFDEVTTLFHEFGHGLHHLLTTVSLSDVAGINGVEWDAVELPSQFMENFAIDKDGIALISRHVQTGEPLPQDKLDALINAKNFQSGLQTLRQVEFALFDLRIHGADLRSYDDILATQNAVRSDVAVIIPPANNRFANTFSHIFAGGYASGYYSYKWAELLSADAFSKFENNPNLATQGVLDPATGLAFKSEILQKGGSRPAKDSFEAFMGRPKDVNALLKQSGFVH